MANTNPARGMRDFLPADVRKRNYVIGIIKEVYESYGFEPLETPAVENIETLTGKYGEEGNQLIFKILKRGEKLKSVGSVESVESDRLEGLDSPDRLADLALRYDLTVPLARVVANHKNDLPKFFKRYQIQPVWRADRPARGRFREFYQCDVDAIGSSSMIVEAELISAVSEILERLRFKDYRIRLNHRAILHAILDTSEIPLSKYSPVLTALDKYDTVGIAGVGREFEKLGLVDQWKKFTEPIKYFRQIELELQVSGSTEINPKLNANMLNFISNFVDFGKVQHPEIKQFDELYRLLLKCNAANKILFDPTLVRGLSYYTGAIMEIILTGGDFKGSIGGGGRYDGLIGMFGKEQIPACGFSLGLERILVVMDERNMFPPEIASSNSADVMVTIWNEDSIGESLILASELRQQGLRVIVYPEADKLGKQFKYAAQINVPYVCVLGEIELAENKVTLKNMETGEQTMLEREDIVSRIKS